MDHLRVHENSNSTVTADFWTVPKVEWKRGGPIKHKVRNLLSGCSSNKAHNCTIYCTHLECLLKQWTDLAKTNQKFEGSPICPVSSSTSFLFRNEGIILIRDYSCEMRNETWSRHGQDKWCWPIMTVLLTLTVEPDQQALIGCQEEIWKMQQFSKSQFTLRKLDTCNLKRTFFTREPNTEEKNINSY